MSARERFLLLRYFYRGKRIQYLKIKMEYTEVSDKYIQFPVAQICIFRLALEIVT